MNKCDRRPLVVDFDRFWLENGRNRVFLREIMFNLSNLHIPWGQLLSWLGVGLVIRGSLVQLPAGALWSVLGQDSLFHIDSVYPAAKWVPSINKAVLRACALYAAGCSGIFLWGLKLLPCVQCLLRE